MTYLYWGQVLTQHGKQQRNQNQYKELIATCRPSKLAQAEMCLNNCRWEDIPGLLAEFGSEPIASEKDGDVEKGGD